MFKKFSVILLILNMIQHASANNEIDYTQLVHNEMAAGHASNLTQQTHPTIYNMVKELAEQALVIMPEYITVYSAEYNVIGRYGTVHRKVCDLNAYVDVLGDIYICREVLTSLSYAEIQGMVALALAQKASNKSLKLATVAISTVGLTVGALYFLNKKYNLQLGAKTTDFLSYSNHRTMSDMEDRMNIMICGMLLPATVVTKLYANNLQKRIDLQAADLVGSANLVNSMNAVDTLKMSYEKENFFSRLATRFNLKSKLNKLFYPIRGYTQAERIAYLQEANK